MGGWLPPPPPPSLPQVVLSSFNGCCCFTLRAHYWLCSWSHQRAVSTQTTAALPLSAAVKTARDLLQVGMTPAPPLTPRLMWMQIRLSACVLRVCYRLWLGLGSGAEILTGVMSPPSVVYGCREELPSGRSAASAREDEIKTTLSFCGGFLTSCFTPPICLSAPPPELHCTLLPSQK